MDEESVDLDLNSLESFNFLFKNLWSVNLAFRAKLNIVDTILFKDGFPYIWFFTSEKTGDILKKKAERLVSVPEIVRALKIKSRSKGYKESSLRTKIATVWYIESSRHISSHIVDEVDLARILDRGLGEVLAVQAFMGGEPAKGNGVFEHRMWMQRNGAVKHITYEMIDVAEDHSLNRFTSHADKLVNNEYQHSLASSLCKHLAAHIGMVNNCRVGSMIFQLSFATGWVPFVVAARKIQLLGAPAAYLSMREQVVYPSGSAPHAPTVDPQALVLPSSVTEDALRRNADALSLRRQIQQHEAGLARDRETKLLRDQEILMEQATQAQVVTHEQEQKSEERMEQLRLRRLIHSQRQSVQNEGQARPMSPSLKVQGNYSDEVRRELERSRMPSERQFVQMKNEMLAIDGVGGVGGSSKQQQEGPSASSKPVRRRTFDEAANTGDAQTGQGQVCPTLDTSRADSAAQFAQGNYVTGDIHARLRAHPQPDQTQTEQGQGGLLKLLGLGTVQGRASLPSSAGALHRDRGGDSQLLKAGLGSTATPGSSPSPQPPTTPYPSRPAVRPRSTSSVGRPRKSDTGDGYSRGRGGGVGRLMASAVAALDSAGAVGLGQAGRAASSGDSYYAVSLALSDALETQHGERKRSPRSLVPVPQPRGGSRRPTSAPSTTRPRVRDVLASDLLPPADQQPHEPLALPASRPRPRSSSSGNERQADLQREHSRGFSVLRPLPLSGLHCFGDYCDFDSRCRAAMDRAGDGQGVVQEQGLVHLGLVQGVQQGLGRGLAQGQGLGLVGGGRSGNCPQQLAFKSILLARAESKSLGVAMDAKVEDLLAQLHTHMESVDVGQLYTYFVRRHLNRVAARCQEEAQDFSLRRTAPAAVLADANNAYRRLVYADALSAVHPSRFYYTVPLCQTCYKIYTCMDAQREVIVLHSPHSHAVSTAAAVAAAEHVRYSPEERQRLLWRREHKSGGGSAGGVGGQTRSPPQPRIEQAEEPVQVQEQAQARGGAGFVDHFPPQPSSPTTSPPPTSPPEEAPPTSVDYSPPQEHRSGSGGSGGGVYASHLRQRVQQSGAQTGERGTGAVEAGTGAGADANGEGLGMYTDGDADVSPESQRRDVWRSRVRSEEPPPARGGTITAWIKLLQDKNANEQGAGAIGGGGASAKGAGAAYHQQLGLQTAAEWDHQGRAPHLQQTSSSRRNSKTLERPGSSDFRRPSSAGATGLRESRSRERSSERSSERSRERGRERGKERSAERGEEKSARVARAPSRSRFRSPPGGAGALGSSGAKRRPHSAGAVPSPATRAMQLQRELQEVQGQAQQLLEFRHGQEDLSDEGIAQLLEQEAAEVAFLAEPSPREVAMAHKMLRLSAQLSARALSPTKCRDRDGRDGRGGWDSRDGTDSRDNRGRSGGAGDAGAGAGAGVGAGDPPTAYQLDHEPAPASTGAETEVDRYLVEVRAAYAYSSLPFMAAPYHPAHKDMPGAPAIAELTQLRIDPQGKRLVQPRPLPAALPPSPQRASKPGKPAPATSFTPVHFRQLRQEWQELLEQRQEQPEHAQTHAQAHMEPMHAQGQAQGETQPQAQKKAQAVEGGEGLLLTQSQGSPAHRQGVGSRAGEGEGEWGYDMAASRLRESTDSRPMSPPVFRNPSPPQRPPPHLTVSLLDPQQQPDTTLHLPLRATHQQQPEKSQQQREVAEVAEEEIRAGGHLGHNLEAPGAVEGEVWESPSSTTPMYLSQTLSASSLPTRTHSTPHSLSPSPLAYPSPSLPHSPVSRDYALSSALSPLLPHSPSPRTQAQKAKAALADGDGGMDGDGDGGTPSSLQHMGISLEQSGDSLTSALTPGAFSAPSTPLTPNAQAQAQHGSSAFARTPASAPVGAPSPYFGSPDSLAPMGLTLDLSPSHLSPSHLLSPDALGSFGGLGSSLSLSPFADMSLSIVAQDSRASP